MVTTEKAKQLKEDLKANPLTKEIIGHPKRMFAFISLYNHLCRICKARAFKNPQGDITQYCPVCQKKCRETLERMK